MIIDMPHTCTRDVGRKVTELHKKRGESATGRVLTLLISVDSSEVEHALEIVNRASREHPCRVIAVLSDGKLSDLKTAERVEVGAAGDAGSNDAQANAASNAAPSSNLDAQVRFGADAGAGEVIILIPRNDLQNHLDTLVIPLLVPEAPVVTWWPTNPPVSTQADPLGSIARSRITDALRSADPQQSFANLVANRDERDVDLSWTRLTVWRGILTSMLDQAPQLPITGAKISGPQGFLPMDLLASWLQLKLQIPVERDYVEGAPAVTGVYLYREDGVISLERPDVDHATIRFPHQPHQPITLPIRELQECMNEELRRIDPDEVYGEVVEAGWLQQ